jgi:hypothetical protein
MQVLVHRWRKCIANGDDYVERQCSVAENVLFSTALLRPLSVVFSVEISRRHYFCSALHIFYLLAQDTEQNHNIERANHTSENVDNIKCFGKMLTR